MLIIINCIIYGICGAVWGSADMTTDKWQFWVSLACLMALQTVNRFMG